METKTEFAQFVTALHACGVGSVAGVGVGVPAIASATPLSTPRMDVTRLVFSAILFWLVTVVTGLAPQLNVTVPLPVRAASNAASVQLSAVPVPTKASAHTGRGIDAAKLRIATTIPAIATASACSSIVPSVPLVYQYNCIW